jgi:hypothetical protein
MYARRSVVAGGMQMGIYEAGNEHGVAVIATAIRIAS